MMNIWLISIFLLLILFLVYAILPTVLIRVSGRGITKRLQEEAIALTFDDGPNPEYTPQLLDLLTKYDVKATFFVVGSKAKSYPDILKRMSQEGHTIGIHHFKHKSNWLLTPWQLKKQLLLTEQAIMENANEKVAFYRPPWGHLNLFSLFLARKYKIILWSDIFGDWKVKQAQTGMLEQLLAATEAGSILLLHDCGETLGADKDAPHFMLHNLEIYLKESKKKGIKFISLNEMIHKRAS